MTRTPSRAGNDKLEPAMQRAGALLVGRPGLLVICGTHKLRVIPVNATTELMAAYRGPEHRIGPEFVFEREPALSIIARVREAGFVVAYVPRRVV